MPEQDVTQLESVEVVGANGNYYTDKEGYLVDENGMYVRDEMGAVVNEHLSYVIDEQGRWIFQDPQATTTTALPGQPVSVEVYGNPMFNYVLGMIVFLIALYFARPLIGRLTDAS